jgi:hypothetical protein
VGSLLVPTIVVSIIVAAPIQANQIAVAAGLNPVDTKAVLSVLAGLYLDNHRSPSISVLQPIASFAISSKLLRGHL